MSVKSIIDVEVNTQEFERFQALFSKYEEQLSRTPSAWAKVSKENAAVSKNFERMAAAMMAQNQLGRETAEANKAQSKHLTRSEQLWTSMAKSTKSVASNILGATRSLISWSGILTAVGGLLGAGGLFGIDRMAASVANQRRSAMGMGMSTGEQSAFRVNFGRVVDPGAYLDWVNQMETDPTKAWSANALGVNLTNKPGADAVRMLDALRAKARSTPVNQLGMLPGQFGLQGTSTEDLRRLRDMSDTEYGKLKSGYGKDVNSLGLPPDVALKWQNFTTQMERAGGSIFKTFVVGLAPLAGPLEHLSDAFIKFLNVILRKDGIAEQAVNTVAHWLESFSGTLSSPKFLENVKQFTADIGALADAAHAVAHPGETISNAWHNIWHPDDKNTASKDAAQSYLSRLDAANSLPAGTLAKIWQQESASSFNPADSKKGAVGPFQIMPRVAAAYGVDSHSFSASGSYAGWQLHQYMEKYHNDLQKAFAAYNWGPRNVDWALKQSGDWKNRLPTETRNYIAGAKGLNAQSPGVRIEIVSPPGNNVVASASQLPH